MLSHMLIETYKQMKERIKARQKARKESSDSTLPSKNGADKEKNIQNLLSQDKYAAPMASE